VGDIESAISEAMIGTGKAITPGLPVNSAAVLRAVSTASKPELQKMVLPLSRRDVQRSKVSALSFGPTHPSADEGERRPWHEEDVPSDGGRLERPLGWRDPRQLLQRGRKVEISAFLRYPTREYHAHAPKQSARSHPRR